MLTPSNAPDDFNDADDLDDLDSALPPPPLDVSARQNLLFIDATADLLSGKEAAPGAAVGLKKLEMWESILQDSGKAGLGKIMQEFAVLRTELESAQPDAHVIAQALASLADETAKVAAATVDKKYEEPLGRLSEALLKLGSTLSK